MKHLTDSDLYNIQEALRLLQVCDAADIFIDLADEMYKEDCIREYITAFSYRETIDNLEATMNRLDDETLQEDTPS